MTMQGAVIRERGVIFTVVVVKQHIVGNRTQADQAIQSFSPLFPGLPVVLMAQDARGVPAYYGRRDIAEFMSNVPLDAVPWKEYSVG
jgi:hypothetical protein